MNELLGPLHAFRRAWGRYQRALGPARQGAAGLLVWVRAQLGWTQEQAARALEVSENHVCQLERGRRPASDALLLRLGTLIQEHGLCHARDR